MAEEKPGVPAGPGGEPLFRYPLDYPVKAMGLAAPDLADHVRALVAAAAPGATLGEALVRPSSGGKYASVTVVARLESEAQRQAIHAALHADPRVLYQL
jgi:hypothetical protein